MIGSIFREKQIRINIIKYISFVYSLLWLIPSNQENYFNSLCHKKMYNLRVHSFFLGTPTARTDRAAAAAGV